MISYPTPTEELVSGQKIPCTIKKGEESFVIDDYYWTEEDYRTVLEEAAGFTVSMTSRKQKVKVGRVKQKWHHT
jgi:hypothetical protein